MPSAFAEFVDAEPIHALPELPLAHTTLGKFVEGICNGGIKPRRCEVLDKDSLYAFYGRAEYRPDTGVAPGVAHSDAPVLPVCFLIKPEIMARATDMYPFDTGAYVKGRYGVLVDYDRVDPKSSLDKFKLTTNAVTPPRFVTRFFENNNQYVNARARTHLDASSTSSRADEYMLLTQSRLSTDIDGRKSALEVIFGFTIPIDSDHIICVFIPDVFLYTYSAVVNNLSNRNFEIKRYGSSSTECSGHIGALRESVRNWLTEKGYATGGPALGRSVNIPTLPSGTIP